VTNGTALVEPLGGGDLVLEKWAVQRKVAFFEKVFDLQVKVKEQRP
jgi:hypothetical protein